MGATQTQTLTRRDLEARLVEKAWKDPDFRKDIVNDPKGMLEKHTGQKLPEQVKIYVHEEDANTLHFSIPPAPSNLNELSDEDLDRVAGGTDAIVTIALTFVASLVGSAGVTAASVLGTMKAAGAATHTGW